MPRYDDEVPGMSFEDFVKMLVYHVLDDRTDTCWKLTKSQAFECLIYLLRENDGEVRYDHGDKHYRVTLDGEVVYCQMPHYKGGWQKPRSPANVQATLINVIKAIDTPQHFEEEPAPVEEAQAAPAPEARSYARAVQAQRDAALVELQAERDAALAQRDAAQAELQAQRDAAQAELQAQRDAAQAQRDAALAELRAELDAALAEIEHLKRQRAVADREKDLAVREARLEAAEKAHWQQSWATMPPQQPWAMVTPGQNHWHQDQPEQKGDWGAQGAPGTPAQQA